jgi:hypothetical protein
MTAQPTVFISYSHQDEAEKNALLSHLGVLQRAGLINVWSDDRIEAGGDWQADIESAMAQAKVAILLITANSLNSDFILNQEVPRLLQRRKDEGLVVYPLIAKPCAWNKVNWLARMNVRPKNGKPVWSKESDPDEELAKIAKDVAEIIEKAGPVSMASPGVMPSPTVSSLESSGPVLSQPPTPQNEPAGGPASGVNISDISGGDIELGNIISGEVGGDVTSGDKVGEDKVGRDKIDAGGDVTGRDKVEGGQAGRDIAGGDINTTYNVYMGSSPQSETSTSKNSKQPEKSVIPSAKWWVPIAVAVIGLIGIIFTTVWNGSGNPTPAPAADFTYQVRVQDKATGANIPNALVTIEVGGKAPLDAITDSTGFARIFVSADHSGQPGRLLVEAEGYIKHRQEIDITEGALPKDVLLEPAP